MESAGAIVRPRKKKNFTRKGSKTKRKDVKFYEGVPQPLDGISESETSAAATKPMSSNAVSEDIEDISSAFKQPCSVSGKRSSDLTEAAGLPRPLRKMTLQQAFEEDAAESLALRTEMKESSISRFEALSDKISKMIAEEDLLPRDVADTLNVLIQLNHEFDVCRESQTSVDLQIMTLAKLLTSLEREHEKCKRAVLVRMNPSLDLPLGQ